MIYFAEFLQIPILHYDCADHVKTSIAYQLVMESDNRRNPIREIKKRKKKIKNLHAMATRACFLEITDPLLEIATQAQ